MESFSVNSFSRHKALSQETKHAALSEESRQQQAALDRAVLHEIFVMCSPITVKLCTKKQDKKESEVAQSRLGFVVFRKLNEKISERIKLKASSNTTYKALYKAAVEEILCTLKREAKSEEFQEIIELAKNLLPRSSQDLWYSILIDSICQFYQTDALTQLIVAIELNDTHVLTNWIAGLLEYCASHGIDSQINTCAGDITALMSAVRKDNILLLPVLMNHGAVIDASNEEGATVLTYAALANNSEAILFLGAQDNAPLNKAMANGYTPLHVAIPEGKNEAVAALLVRKANTEIRSARNGLTPLLMAIERKSPYVVALLLKYNAQVNVLHDPELEDESALMFAITTYGCEKRAELLSDAGELAKAGRVISLLLQDSRIDVAWKNKSGTDAALLAAYYQIFDDALEGIEKLT